MLAQNANQNQFNHYNQTNTTLTTITNITNITTITDDKADDKDEDMEVKNDEDNDDEIEDVNDDDGDEDDLVKGVPVGRFHSIHHVFKKCFYVLSMPESLKAVNTANSVRGTFWTSGEHFGPKFTIFCRICSFVANHALLTVFLSVFYSFCNKNQQDKLNCVTET